ncbi:membrane protein insertase YidC [Pararhodonellum marinum]|uniref:membrane protein insertase YidC n=1 Tax=Pararhodonellum marinum TaxID=2755358 RepID=UPI00188F7E94|nr:membrane protein insertase YidC [Pararhodonellum marinum]
MDKNQATGLILFAAVILVYSLFFASSPEPREIDTPETTELPAERQAEELTETPYSATVDVLPDSLRNLQNEATYGVFASLVIGEEKEVLLENDKMVVTFSSKGGEIKRVELKEHKTWDQRPLYLLDEESSSFDYQMSTSLGMLSLNDFYFEFDQSNAVNEEEEPVQSVRFTASTPSGKLVRTYSLANEAYVVTQQIELQGLERQVSSPEITILWEDELKKLEADIEESRRKTYMNFYTVEGSYDYLSTSSDLDEKQVADPLKWVGFSQRFFTAAMIAENSFNNAFLTQMIPTDTSFVKGMGARMLLPIENNVANMDYYFGPNNYNVLRKITPGFEKNVDMGYFFVSWVNKYIIVNLFQFLEKYFTNYGVIIILIVFIIKLFLFPLTYKSYVGMAKMRLIKPEIDELKEKYKDDPTKQQQEQMKLFGQLGVSPISGCLPMLLQMPFLFAMFFFFPNSIELRQKSFLWAHDLSTYDSVLNLPFTIPFYGSHVSLFVILMAVSQVAYTRFNNQLTAAQGPMKNIGYIMPIMFMFVLNSYPAALSFYYFVSNLVTFGQQALIKLFVDDTKIRAKVEENKKKNVNKKKSKFQLKLEEAMKTAEASKKKK